MSDSWELDDPDQTWKIGKSIAELDTDASSYGKGLVDTLGDVSPGGDAPGKKVQAAIEDFQTDTSQTSHELAHHVRTLGDGVIAGAKEAADTNNEGTKVANKMGDWRETYHHFPFNLFPSAD